MKTTHILFVTLLTVVAPLSAANDDFLDKPISAYKETKADRGFISFCDKVLKRPCGLEMSGYEAPDSPPLDLVNTTPRQILDNMAKQRDSQWHVVRDVVTMEPLKRPGEDFLSRKLTGLKMDKTSSLTAALDAFDQAGINVSYQEMGHRRRFDVISLDLKDVTVREALNEIVKADGQLSWAFASATAPGSKRNGTLIFFSERTAGGLMASDEIKKTRRWKREHKGK